MNSGDLLTNPQHLPTENLNPGDRIVDRLFPMRRSKRSITPKELLKLWRAYTKARAKRLSPATIARDYDKIKKTIEKLPRSLDTAIEIRDYLTNTFSHETSRRLIMQFNACCNWARRSELIPSSPFNDLGKDFCVVKRNQGKVIAFTRHDRDAIIKAFRLRDRHGYEWVSFLFLSGCRLEEARALDWGDISPDCSQIHFWKAAPIGAPHIIQETKNHKQRYFPCADRLQALLIEMKRAAQPNATTPLFNSSREARFDYSAFGRTHWNPTMKLLVETGAIPYRLPQKHTRHTWITLALEKASIEDVAYCAGNTPAVIYSNYASRKPKIKIPED